VGDAGYAQVAAIDQPATAARFAVPTMPSKPADPNALPLAPADHASANCIDRPGDLVSRDARKRKAGILPFDSETIAVAPTAGLDANAHLTPLRLGHVAFDNFQCAAGPRHLHRPHLCHR